MSHVGTQLRDERESQKKTRAEVARDTGLLIHHLSALEHGSFDTLPDDETAAGFVKTYAEYLGFQPDEPVAEFWAERRADRPAETPTETTRPELVAESPPDVDMTLDEAPPTPPAEPTPAAARQFPWGWMLTGAVLLVIVVAFALRGGGTESTEPVSLDPPPATAGTTEIPNDPAPVPAEPEEVPTPPAEIDSTADPVPDPATSGLHIEEHGVGTGVENRRLVGESNRFRTGDRIWFWTRVEGGASGDRVRHTWIHEGREISSLELAVGSSNWRTQSAKTLFAGSAGRWAVEARDPSGRVLARSEFVCADD